MLDFLSRIDPSKNSKFRYYLNNYLSLSAPDWLHKQMLNCAPVNAANQVAIADRVNYYHRWSRPFSLGEDAVNLAQFRQHARKTYFFDLYRYIRLFPKARFCYRFGDVRDVPECPTFVKSRPIVADNHPSILLNLNKIRHFIKANDVIPYTGKKDLLVWRGAAYQPHRKLFMERFIDHPRCNIGQTNHCDNRAWMKERMTISEQLQYKFVMSLEGNDVASNLKWIMSSNSLAVMPKPKFETWFMEGRLQAGVHYVEVKDDFSDLEQQMDYYLSHPKEAAEIIANAQRYVAQFQNEALENTIAITVISRYLNLSRCYGESDIFLDDWQYI